MLPHPVGQVSGVIHTPNQVQVPQTGQQRNVACTLGINAKPARDQCVQTCQRHEVRQAEIDARAPRNVKVCQACEEAGR